MSLLLFHPICEWRVSKRRMSVNLIKENSCTHNPLPVLSSSSESRVFPTYHHACRCCFHWTSVNRTIKDLKVTRSQNHIYLAPHTPWKITWSPNRIHLPPSCILRKETKLLLDNRTTVNLNWHPHLYFFFLASHNFKLNGRSCGYSNTMYIFCSRVCI